MTADSFLALLESVRSRGPGKWSARCPAHDDKNPSLSVREGYKGLLLRCWSGCDLEGILSALGLTLRDLFYDSDLPAAEWRSAYRTRVQDRQRREAARYVDGLLVDSCREAEKLIQSACGLDISGWPQEQLDAALNSLANAYELMEKEQAHG